MYYKTINTLTPVNLFRQLMLPSSQNRVMHLVGDAKMGKTHLLTKVFPHLVQQDYQARYAILDLSNQIYQVPDILNQACFQLGDTCCDGYFAAAQAWSNRPKVDVRGLNTTFSRVGIFAKDGVDDANDKARNLTIAFAKDVGKLNDKLLVLLFDCVDEQAEEEMRTWLTGMLMVALFQFAHIRVVIAGRSLAEAHPSYKALSLRYQLLPVKEIAAYVEYCQDFGLTLPEQSVQTLAHAFDYIPGSIAEVLLKFMPQRISNG
jgi:hypothetical protein